MKIKILAALLIFAALQPTPASACEVAPYSRDKIVFFGDSTTAHLKLRGGIPEERVWSGQANTVLFSSVNDTRPVYFADKNRSVSLAEAVREKRPAIFVITLGVSGGAGTVPEARFKLIYKKMIDTIRRESPDTTIFAQSILPLSDKSPKHFKLLTKESVEEANGWIKQVCDETGICYINTYPLLCGENGYLKKIYQNDEYMHLTRQAYDVILDNVYKTIEENTENGR